VFQIHLFEVLSARPHELVLVFVFQIHLFEVISPKNSLVLFSVCFLCCLSKLDERGCLCCFRFFQIHLFEVLLSCVTKWVYLLFEVLFEQVFEISAVCFLCCLSKWDERGCLCCFRFFQIHLFEVLLSCVTKWVYLLFEVLFEQVFEISVVCFLCCLSKWDERGCLCCFRFTCSNCFR
jgi:hypothetical protein